MPKKKTELDPAEQRRLFVEAAREAGYDASGEAFENAFKKLVPPKKVTRKGRKKRTA